MSSNYTSPLTIQSHSTSEAGSSDLPFPSPPSPGGRRMLIRPDGRASPRSPGVAAGRRRCRGGRLRLCGAWHGGRAGGPGRGGRRRRGYPGRPRQDGAVADEVRHHQPRLEAARELRGLHLHTEVSPGEGGCGVTSTRTAVRRPAERRGAHSRVIGAGRAEAQSACLAGWALSQHYKSKTIYPCASCRQINVIPVNLKKIPH